MKKLNLFLLLHCVCSFLLVLLYTSCCDDEGLTLVGESGNPRFNLIFTNEESVDLDLHVIDPQGVELYYSNESSPSGGEFDVDCLCGDCPQGPNENIYWPLDGSAPKGKYEYWIEYFD